MELQVIKKRVAGRETSHKWSVLRDCLLEEMQSGEYKSGQMLPSENQLSKSVGVARNTVRQAIDDLEKDGFVRRVKGSGTYVEKVYKRLPNSSNKIFDAYSLVIPEIRRTLYPSLVKGLDTRSREDCHQVLICNTDYDISKQGDIILQLVDKGMAGVVMVPPTLTVTPAHHIRQLHSNHIPVVFCHRRVPGVSAPFIGWDIEDVGNLAGRTFIERGHRNIAFFGVYKYEITEAYEKGLRKALGSSGLELSESNIIYGPDREVSDRDEIKDERVLKLLRCADRPTAIFCSDDNEAERVFWHAQSEGIDVPRDLSIIGFGDTRRSSVFQKRLCSVAVDEFSVGVKAAEVLGQMCSGGRNINSEEEFLVNLSVVGDGTIGSVTEGDIF